MIDHHLLVDAVVTSGRCAIAPHQFNSEMRTVLQEWQRDRSPGPWGLGIDALGMLCRFRQRLVRLLPWPRPLDRNAESGVHLG